MSLLHDALKKAEREGEASSRVGVVIDPEGASRPFPTRTILLTGVALIALSTAVYFRLVKRPSSTVVPAPKGFGVAPFQTPLQIGGGPAAPELASIAIGLIQAGKLEEARSNLEKVTILEPRNAEIYNNLGMVLKKLGRNEEAFEQYQRALSIDPNCAECYNNLGVLYLSNRNTTEAEVQFQKAISLKPDYANPYFHLGLLLEARGDLTGARKNYQKFVDLARGVDASFLLKIQQRISSLESS